MPSGLYKPFIDSDAQKKLKAALGLENEKKSENCDFESQIA
jgi:hypothetical protein